MHSVKFHPISLERKGKHLSVMLSLHFFFNEVPQHSSHIYTPVLSKGENRYELPSVLLAGKRRFWTLRFARLKFCKTVLSSYNIMTVIRAISHSHRPYFYRTRVLYEHWMDDADLSLIN